MRVRECAEGIANETRPDAAPAVLNVGPEARTDVEHRLSEVGMGQAGRFVFVLQCCNEGRRTERHLNIVNWCRAARRHNAMTCHS